MPCYKCSNGKYKYGKRGNCQFDTLGACEAAAPPPYVISVYCFCIFLSSVLKKGY